MYQLVYSSRDRMGPISGPEFRTMLTGFRAHNQRVGISGLLLHSFGRFLQLIEGERREVDALFARIAKDRRHHDIRRLDLPLPRRLFQNWSMAFMDIEETAHSIPGFAGSAPDIDLHQIDEPTTREMLMCFSDLLTRGHDAVDSLSS